MNKFAIIVAGGTGKRMNTETPKQFLPLNEKPILMHTLQLFNDYDTSIMIILVLPKGQIDYWRGLIKKHDFRVPHVIAEGGKTRFHSVKKGLKMITEKEGIVGVHDGVRPLVSYKTLKNCFETALQYGNAIPVVPAVESVRYQEPDKSNKALERDKVKLVQTPQLFDLYKLQKAYKQDYNLMFTDDASVYERLIPESLNLVEGNRENIKITTPQDLEIAKLFLKRNLY